ncbi:hypothetical protein [Spiroplasma taiwanense]|uniref:Transmembrane protein n=1 Tax=Spiroplasma taiwanense CT-1 TaxID=1276220 RepID=S5LXX8_9MOLU|nr:hypothetical protein [Spiroplasma taiwanense]AGR41456.1 hypothetical protein STAIW_v1c08700 [Spiroplasma taiwanense CT-1]
MKEQKNTSNLKKLKDLREQEKLAHKQEISDKVKKLNSDPLETRTKFIHSKKLRWYDYLIIFGFSTFIIGLAFILGIFAFQNIEKTEWIITAIAVFGLLVWLILGWYKNKQVAKFYNDVRRRYQSSLSEEEGHLRRISKIILLICLILVITSIILGLILWV